MSGGEQQMLAIGRALMSQPSLVVLNEISFGRTPAMIDRPYYARSIRGRGNAQGGPTTYFLLRLSPRRY
jgi:hypothetical protein